MRILHLGKYYPPARGGIETHVQTLARFQHRLGAEVDVICFNHATEDGRDRTGIPLARTRTRGEIDDGVRVRRLGRWAQLAGADFAPRMFAEIARGELRRYDVVHLHTPNPALLAACAVEPRVRALVVTHHSDIVRQKRLARVHEPVEEHTYRRASMVLSDSPGYVDGSAVLQRHLERVEVLPLGIDLAPYGSDGEVAMRSADALVRDAVRPLWLFVGRLVYYKGIDVAIRALVEVQGTLAIVGNGPMERPARELAESLGVADRVLWLGQVDDLALRGLYRIATALWFPSTERSEGFGLVQVEAMASGCPVINTAVPHSGVSWVSMHDESGLTVPVRDAQALAGAARLLAGDRDLRERLASGSRDRARRMFSADVMGRASLALYERAIARGNA